jgi:hypothetical protein
MKFRKTSLAVSVSLALAACGGGGGGGGSSPYIRSSVPYYTPTSGGSFSVYAVPSTKSAVLDVYAKDLNSDNVEEVVVGGRMSQPATVAEWQPTNLQIYGWNTGSFSRETDTWFSGTENQIVGTEPGIRFGDFNGDGNPDMFLTPSTDGVNVANTGVVFMNTGSSSFTRQDLNFGSAWSHDAAVSDLDGDGHDDIIIADYNSRPAIAFGSAAGTFVVYQAITDTGGSGISIADYLGNGTKTIVITDATAVSGNQDTKLFSWDTSSGNLVLTELATLPASRFSLAKWSAQLAAAGVDSHDIRNITMDFNQDGRPDVIVISTLPDAANSQPSHGFSEVQFLRNDGSGSFTDVTDSVLFGFNTGTFAAYQPRLIDVNQDGLTDILLSGGDYQDTHDSTQVLLQTSDGKFVASYASTFTDFLNQTAGMSGANAQGSVANIAVGPNGDYYLITAINYVDGADLKSTVYAAKIGSNNTTSVQQTLANISTVWPYLTSREANDALARTASSFINGIPVIDWEAALSPIGGLGITLDGRKGTRIMLSGSISVPGMDRSLLTNLQAVDALGRNFGVNLTGMAETAKSMPISYSMADTTDITRNWSSRFVHQDRRDWNGFSISGQDSTHFSTSMSNRHFGDRGPWTARIGMTVMPGSPWFNFNGVFGQVESSNILDFSATRAWPQGWFVQGGAMQTSTQMRPGLIRSVSPLWAGYAVGGYQDPHWSVYAGLQPTIFAGHLDMKLPTSVDKTGTMHYTDTRVNIRNQAVSFVGLERRWLQKTHTWKLSAVATDSGQVFSKLTYEAKF